MLRPKPLGWLLLGYVILAKPWSVIDFLMLVGRDFTALEGLQRALEALVILCYVGGSIGLILLRRRGSLVVLLAAGTDLVVGLVGGFSLQRLLGLVFPASFAYAALWLWKHGEAWFSSPALVSSGERGLVPRWFRRLFWTIIGIGLALPPLMGVIVREVLKAQGETVAPLSGEIVVIMLLFTAPFIALAFLGSVLLKDALQEAVPTLMKKRFVLVGALVGISFITAWTLLESFRNMENFAIIFFFPIYPFFLALLGAAMGGLVGWGTFHLFRRIAKPM